MDLRGNIDPNFIHSRNGKTLLVQVASELIIINLMDGLWSPQCGQ